MPEDELWLHAGADTPVTAYAHHLFETHGLLQPIYPSTTFCASGSERNIEDE